MEKYCSQCGAKVMDGKFCEECGAPLDTPHASEPVKPEPRQRVPYPDRPPIRKASRGRLPLIFAGVAMVVVMLVGVWYLQKAKVSPEVLDAFPPPTTQQQPEQVDAQQEPPAATARYEDFVGNWIVNQNGKEAVFWIQEVEGRYVGADDFTIMEFSEIQERSIKGVVTDGPESGAKVTVVLSTDSNAIKILIAPAQKSEIRFEGIRNTSLGQGTVTSDDITALEIMVTTAFKEKETAQGTALADKEAALETAVQELGSALQIYYVAEGKRDLSEAQKHLREFLMTVTYNGFGMSEAYVEQLVKVSLAL